MDEEDYQLERGEPWSLHGSLGFDDADEFDDYCDEVERKNRPNQDD